MTKIAKAFVVLVTLCSAGFMAVALVNVLAGGPNYQREYVEKYDELAFEQANPQAPYTVKRRTDLSDMGNGRILPEAIVNAQKKMTDQLNTEIRGDGTPNSGLDNKIAQRDSSIKEAKAWIEIDLKALLARQEQLDAELKRLQEEVDTTFKNYNLKSDEVQGKLDVTKLRREEYLLLKNQLEELKTQRVAVSNELARLRDLVYQAKSNLKRSQTRTALLKADGIRVDDGYAEESTPEPESAPPETEKSDSEAPEEQSE